MIDRTHGLSITRQAAALGISRGAVYYTPHPVSVFDVGVNTDVSAEVDAFDETTIRCHWTTTPSTSQCSFNVRPSEATES